MKEQRAGLLNVHTLEECRLPRLVQQSSHLSGRPWGGGVREGQRRRKKPVDCGLNPRRRTVDWTSHRLFFCNQASHGRSRSRKDACGNTGPAWVSGSQLPASRSFTQSRLQSPCWSRNTCGCGDRHVDLFGAVVPLTTCPRSPGLCDAKRNEVASKTSESKEAGAPGGHRRLSVCLWVRS